MKKFYILSILLVLAILLGGCGNKTSTPQDNYVGGNLKYEADGENETTSNTTNEAQISRISVSAEDNNQTQTPPRDEAEVEKQIEEQNKTEEKLGEFSTKIYDKDAERQHNLELSCSKINEHIVKAGETFSFCDTVGKATSSAGYEKAKIFDKNGNVKEGYGGGNCQVSTTLFNAVRNLSGIEVTERHDHSNKVPYAKAGDDAAVAYGGYDFKFINHNDYDIIIHAESNKSNVIVTINKIG